MKRGLFLVLFSLAGVGALLGLDRDAFTITDYHLNVMVDRNTHVMAVDGRLTLRNDSKSPQKNLALQISSSLQWNQVQLGDQSLAFLAENYTSDIDHTGGLSEAIVTLPSQVAPAETIALDIRYGGAVTADATRLTRMGAPQDLALQNDWDQIGEPFTAVRGLGYVVWYPVAIEAVSMSDGSAVSDAIARWKERHRNTHFLAYVGVTKTVDMPGPCIASNIATGPPEATWRVGAGIADAKPKNEPEASGNPEFFGITLQRDSLAEMAPAFAMLGACDRLSRSTVQVTFTPEHSLIAKDYAVAAEADESLLIDWLPPASSKPIRIIELTYPDANPFQSETTLFVPLRSSTQQNLQLLLLPTQVAARLASQRAWMQSGLGFFLQAANIRQHDGRSGALRYLSRYQDALAKAEELAHPSNTPAEKAARTSESDNTLLNTADEIYLRVKGGFVFWMLSDMLGDSALQHALAEYRGSEDKDPIYFQKLLEKETRRNLEWFFDDWIYRDRGLPDFRVESASSRKVLSGNADSYQVTAVIENRGGAGAEVPVIVQTASGEKVVRVLVPGHDKGVGRVDVPSAPVRVIVNDGSVPEADITNNSYELETRAAQ